MFEKLFQMRLKRIERRGERQKAKQELVDKYAQYYPGKRRKVSNVMLAIIVVAVSAYTIASFWLTYASGVSMDSTLTTCFYAFWSSELIALATLKTSKIIKSNVTNIESDRTNSNEDTVG